MKPVVRLADEFPTLKETWSPRVVAQVNDQYVKVARIQGEFTWHKHDHEDELFLVMRGSLVMQYQDRGPVALAEGDLHVVPRGVMHNPVAEEECWVALVESVTTKHTGEQILPGTRSIQEQLDAGGEDGDGTGDTK